MKPTLGARASSVSLERFEVRRTLGSGTFGVVYEAYDRERDEVVALKTLHRQEPEEFYYFKQEFRVLADLTHPNLVTLYELLWNGEQLCFTMELVDGLPFLDYVGRPADPDRLRRAIVQLSDGLTALHRADKLHRDIKPSNVLVSSRGRVVLLDFGLASDLRQRTSMDAFELGGTPAYMSPEQRGGLPLSSASDWYSVGVVVHEALTGELPPRDGSLDLLRKAQDRWGHPADLVDVCTSLLHRSPDRRTDGRGILGRFTPALLGIAEPQVGYGGGAASPPFVGRDPELGVLRDAFADVGRGRPRAVFVAGPSGIGKSALTARFVDDIRQADPEPVVLMGRCYEREAVPFKAVDALVDALSRVLNSLPAAQVAALLPEGVDTLARLFPVLNRVATIAAASHAAELAGGEETRRQAFRALRVLLANLAHARRVVLVIDDLQWGDLDSAPLLAELLRPPDAPALLLLGVYRSEELETSPFLAALRDFHDFTVADDASTVLALGELPPQQSETLALALIGSASASARARAVTIAREARGNPFFIGALAGLASTRLVALDASGRGFQQDDLAASDTFTLDAVVERRVALLPREARTLLEIVAIAGRPIRRTLARRAAGLGREYQGAVGVLGAAGLLRTRRAEPEELLETFHDRIRESVVSHLSHEVRRQRHATLAAEIERLADPDLETLALHHLGAGDNAKAARYAVLAGDRAFQALAFALAGRLYRMALDLGAGPGDETRALHSKLGDALSSAGHGAEAAAAYLVAAEGASLGAALEWRRRAAQQLLGSGRLDQGLAVLSTVLERVQMRLAKSQRRALLTLLLRRLRVRMRGLRFSARAPETIPADELTRVDTCWSVAGMLSWVDTIRGADFQARHLLLALECGDPCRVVRALALEAAYSATAGESSRPRTAAILEACRAAAAQTTEPYARAISIGTIGGVAFMEARWRESVERCLEADRIYREHCRDVAWERDTVEFFVLGSLFYLGEWRDLSGRLSAVMHDARLRGDLLIDAVASIRFATFERLLADAADEASTLLASALGQWTQRGFHLQHFYALQQAVQIALYQGDAESAWRQLGERWSVLLRSGLLRVQTLRIEALYLRGRVALAAAGGTSVSDASRRRLLKVAEKAAEGIAKRQALNALPTAELLRAGLAAQRGDVALAERQLAAAETGFRAADMTAHAMIASRRRGQLQGGAVGRQLVTDADAYLSAQGARRPERIAALFAPGAWEVV